MAEEALVVEALRRGLIDDAEARRQLGMTHPVKPEERSFAESLMGHLKAGGTGIAETAAATVGLPGDVQELVSKLPDSKTFGKYEPPLRLPRTPEVREAAGDVTGMSLYKPQTTGEQYTKSMMAGASSLFNPFNPLGKAAPLFGAAMGLAGEAGAQGMKEQPELGRGATQAIMLLAGAYPAMKLPQVVKAVREYLQELGPTGIQAADKIAKGAAKRLGVDSMVLTQGTDTQTALSGITQAIKNEPGGVKIRQTLDAQLPAAQSEVAKLVDALSQSGFSQEAANKVVMAGKTAAYSQPREAVQKATAPLYNAASKEKMPLFGQPGTPSVQEIVNNILGNVESRSIGLAPAGKTAQRTIKTLGEVEDAPRITELDALARGASDAAKASYKEGASAKEVAARQGHEAVADAINAVTTARSPALAGGKMVNTTGYEWLRDPAKKGALGQMFPETMANKGVANFDTLAASMPNNADDVRAIAQGLSKADKEAFPALVKKDWLNKVEEAAKSEAGRDPVSFLTKVPNALRGAKGSQQAAAFNAKIEEVAKLHGLDPVAARESANELMDSMLVAAREQGGRGGVSPGFFEGGAEFFTRLLRSMSFTAPGRGAGWWLEKQNYGRIVDDLTRALTEPDGMKKLIEISEYSGKAHKVKAMARGLAAAEVQQQGARSSNGIR